MKAALVLTVLLTTFAGQLLGKGFQFRHPQMHGFEVEEKVLTDSNNTEWIHANVGTNTVQFGARIVLQVSSSEKLRGLLASSSLKIKRSISPDLLILEAPNARIALQEAERLSQKADVKICYPVTRREVSLHGAYAYQPNDYWFPVQAYLENRYADGSRPGADLNSLAAWPYSRGNGVIIAIGDTGIETDHPDLVDRTGAAPHYNFLTQTNDGTPTSTIRDSAHGTAVAGLAAATANNQIGIAGIAPEARLASWVLFTTNSSSTLYLADDESLMDMFQYQSNVVQVQNHSWGSASSRLESFGPLADIGISNAVTFGRNGLGSVIVRSAGNGRVLGQDANEDGLGSDPRVICVGASTFNGRAANYSNPGACLLFNAVGGDTSYFMMTTDRQGANGYNSIQRLQLTGKPIDTNAWNYTYNFTGTSASAPQISGLAALLLSANPTLTYRDLQQLLIFASRHFDFADADLATNGAGFLVSHNVGFGIPDAGEAVRLAKRWQSRPPKTELTVSATNSVAIPDAGLRVRIAAENLPVNLQSLICAPGLGPHADSPTAVLPLVDVGVITNQLAINLTNKAALIEQGKNSSQDEFSNEITKTAQAGAAFAIIFNTSDSLPSALHDTDFTPIPAVLIGQTAGLALRDFLQTNSANAQIALNSTHLQFTIPNTLICEHVGLRLSFNHPSRADLRITLTSPQGTRSILQHVNGDTSAAPTDWTYWTTHHFYESSAGTWMVTITDEFPGDAGTVESAALTFFGVPISDSDHDALDDSWEISNFGSLSFSAKDDNDRDGYNNAREQILGSNPNVAESLQLNLSSWNKTTARLSWPGNSLFNYEVWTGTNVTNLTLKTNLAGRFPETEWFLPNTSFAQFLKVIAQPVP